MTCPWSYNCWVKSRVEDLGLLAPCALRLPLHQTVAHPFNWTVCFGISGFSTGLEHHTSFSSGRCGNTQKGLPSSGTLKTNENITGDYMNPDMMEIQQQKQSFLYQYSYIIFINLWEYVRDLTALYCTCVFLWKKDIFIHSYKTIKIHLSIDMMLISSP